jgi:hypothetical protein
MATALASLRPVPLSLDRAGCGAQHMDAIPKNCQLDKNY